MGECGKSEIKFYNVNCFKRRAEYAYEYKFWQSGILLRFRMNSNSKERSKLGTMELNINSPAYFSNQYGVDDDVYRYCQKLYEFFKDKEYSETLSVIGIVPIIAPKELYEQGMWKECTQIISLGSCAIINIRMDFESYYQADSNGKIELMKEMIVRAVKKIKTKCKFDIERFREDLLSL